MKISRRHVFFLAGFDPRGSSYYHALYQKQASRQAALTGYNYDVGPLNQLDNGNSSWFVKSCLNKDEEQTITTIESLNWDDLVRSEWPSSKWRVFFTVFRSYRSFWGCGKGLFKTWLFSPKSLLSLLPGFLGIIISFLLILLSMFIAGYMSSTEKAGLVKISLINAIIAGTFSAGMVFLFWGRFANTLVMAIPYVCGFLGRLSKGYPKKLESRLNFFSQQIDARLKDPNVDEVLLVGYSAGTILVISTLAKLLAQRFSTDSNNEIYRRLSVLTLGHCIPLLGLMPRAHQFRRELSMVSLSKSIYWVDVSAPEDWISFPLISPVSLCLDNLQDRASYINPRAMRSPQFHSLFDETSYHLLRKNKLRMHFQYLMAGQKEGEYDYFQLTAGPLLFYDRFKVLEGTTVTTATTVVSSD